MEGAFTPPENSFTDFGSIIFALISRNLQFASEPEENASERQSDAGIVLAKTLRDIYLKEPFAEEVGLPKQNKLTLDDALWVARALSGALNPSADTSKAHQQLIQHVCHVLLLQADCGSCGMPTAILAFTLLLLLTQSSQDQQSIQNLQGVLSEQGDLFIAAFKRVSAGKAFSQCAIHKHKECCLSAQGDLTAAFSLLASYSYSTQQRLWDHGNPLATSCAAANVSTTLS